MAPNICESSVWKLLHVNQLVPRIFRWLLDFWQICAILMLWFLEPISSFIFIKSVKHIRCIQAALRWLALQYHLFGSTNNKTPQWAESTSWSNDTICCGRQVKNILEGHAMCIFRETLGKLQGNYSTARYRQQVSPKYWYPPTKLQSIIPQEVKVSVFTVMKL